MKYKWWKYESSKTRWASKSAFFYVCCCFSVLAILKVLTYAMLVGLVQNRNRHHSQKVISFRHDIWYRKNADLLAQRVFEDSYFHHLYFIIPIVLLKKDMRWGIFYKVCGSTPRPSALEAHPLTITRETVCKCIGTLIPIVERVVVV
jgi:hypothetical protein